MRKNSLIPGRKSLALALSLAMLGTALAGCSNTSDNKTSEPAGSTQAAQTEAATEAVSQAENPSTGAKKLIIGSGQSWATTDVINSYDGWYYIRYGIGETLTKMTNDMSIEGWLVEDNYSVSEDQTTWTFTIKEGVKFSNGNVCDANAVKASLENVMNNGARASEFFTAKEITADGQTLTITCEKAEPILPNKLADPYFTIVDVSVPYTEEGGNIGTGPFVLESFDTTDKTTYVKKNENYWAGEVKLDEVEFVYTEDQSALTLALTTGEFDAVYNVSMADIATFEGNSDYTISKTTSGRTAHGFINQTRGALADVNVRRAIMQCIDKETICEYQLNGQYVAGETLVTSAADYGYGEIEDSNGYDLESANKLLDDGGYLDTNGDGIREDKDGNPMEYSFIYYSGRPEQQVMVEATQMAAAEIGIKITPVLHETKTVMDELKAGEFDLLCMSINVLNMADPENHLNTYFKEGGSYASYGFKNAEFNTILDELSSTADAASRKELVKNASKILMDEAVAIFFCYPVMNFTMKNNVTGIESTPADYYWINANTDIN